MFPFALASIPGSNVFFPSEMAFSRSSVPDTRSSVEFSGSSTTSIGSVIPSGSASRYLSAHSVQ